MPAEGVVDALRKVRRSLRPEGVLIDSHPDPYPVPLVIRSGTASRQVGRLEYSSAFTHAIGNASQAEASLVADGTFRREGEENYEFLLYLSTFDEWQAYWAIESGYYEPPGDALHDALRVGLAPGGSQLVVSYQVKTKRFGIPPGQG